MHPRTNPITHTYVFFGDHFATGQTGFNLTHFDNGIAFIHALYRTRNNGFTTLEEIVKHLLTFSITNTLQNGLLCCLRTNTTELNRIEWLFNVVTHLNIGVVLYSIAI